MARDANGAYTLPLGDVVTATTITSNWANTTLGDIRTELSDSLSRSGKGSMLAPLKLADGTSALPGMTFGSETSSGLYRASAGALGISVLGAPIITVNGDSIQLLKHQREVIFDLALSSTLNVNNGPVQESGDLTGQTIAYSFSGTGLVPSTSSVQYITLKLNNASAGTISFATPIQWPGGVLPVFGVVDWITIAIQYNGSSYDYYGFPGGLAMALA